MFSATGNKGFSITFENGNTVSVQWGPGNYCDSQGAAYDAPVKAIEDNQPWTSGTAEVAAWDKDGKWHNCGHDQVKGWLSPAEVVEFLSFAANNELDIRPVWSTDEDEDEDEDEDKDSNSGDASNYAAPI